MPLRETEVAIVGDGPAGQIAWGVHRHAGVPAAAMAAYGDTPEPLGRLRRYAAAIDLRRMRSEGNGHMRPLEVPGLAWRDAWERRSPLPLLAALLHRYTPDISLLVRDASEAGARSGFADGRIQARIGRVERAAATHFQLYDEAGALIGRTRHLILALGHPAQRWPAELAGWRGDPRVWHAYQSHPIAPGQRVLVVGSGMGAAHVWAQALAQGASVFGLHRRPWRHQALNAPRCQFNAAALDNLRLLSDEAQHEAFAARPGGTFPRRLEWAWAFWLARRQGRFRAAIDSIAGIETTDGAALRVRLAGGAAILADRIISATGFEPAAAGHPLLRRLIEDYSLPIRAGQLQLSADCLIPELSNPASMCGVVGAAARWALPAADTFVGMRYAARLLAGSMRRAAVAAGGWDAVGEALPCA